MKLHKHRFDNIEGYLHHRTPYLLVEGIVSISDDQIVTSKKVRGDEFFLTGHFPGAPIFPGAMMQELTTQSAGILLAAEHNPMEKYDTNDPFFNEYALGVLVKVKQARYRTFARPGDEMTVTVKMSEAISNIFDFKAEITVAGKKIMNNSFQLTNIKSATLQGAG